MRIFNEDKTIELKQEDLDLTKGRLIDDVLITHHDAITAVKEIGHFETIKEYPNGGKDVEWIVDEPGREGQEAYDETEHIQVWKEYTEKELKVRQINTDIANAKDALSESDYHALKFMEGFLSEEEYAPMREYRQSLRNKINSLEEELANLETDCILESDAV